jgi:dihydropteroate synthase
MIIGNRVFDTENKYYIMGILNVTPDSFSDGGKWAKLSDALFQTERMIEDGADIIDIGGESTRPGHNKITVEEEIGRVLPIIEAVNKTFDIPISVDTYKSTVAEVALSAGASLVNDIWGLKHDPKMAGLIARTGVACCLMHNRKEIDYSDFMRDIKADMLESVDLAKNAGISADKIILDPGIGFAKTHKMNLEAINKLDKLCALGYPILLGTSKKSVVGLTLNLPITERMEGTLATNVIGIVRGCSFLRVHDVKETKRAVKVTEAILNEDV